MRGRQLGFRGMIAIHPSHVATVNEVFTPSAETVAFYEGITHLRRPHPIAIHPLRGKREPCG